MKKILVVAEDEEVRRAMRERIMNIMDLMGNDDVECAIISHSEAVKAFKERKPDIAIVCDYENGSFFKKGFQTYKELLAVYAFGLQRILCVGPQLPYTHSNYIVYPGNAVSMERAEELFCSSFLLWLRTP